jgi:hypothetical protein
LFYDTVERFLDEKNNLKFSVEISKVWRFITDSTKKKKHRPNSNIFHIIIKIKYIIPLFVVVEMCRRNPAIQQGNSSLTSYFWSEVWLLLDIKRGVESLNRTAEKLQVFFYSQSLRKTHNSVIGAECVQYYVGNIIDLKFSVGGLKEVQSLRD